MLAPLAERIFWGDGRARFLVALGKKNVETYVGWDGNKIALSRPVLVLAKKCNQFVGCCWTVMLILMKTIVRLILILGSF